MPTYELTVLFKTLPKEELFNAVKRTATSILSEGGILRKLDGLGINRPTPLKITSHGKTHSQASYFLYTFDSPTSAVKVLRTKYSYDIEIVRAYVCTAQMEMSEKQCQLEDELQPAPYRKEVMEIVAHEDKKKKPRFPLNTGLDYNPLP